ncbi:LOW QUALITY PROTEIN: tetraspanin-31 [Excalfactoria chinensis]|uniref:LOW QUALITY PROTEIN: tetraspanin-31 n=1 Tax=Excalfactoria chinensis TaxID=46218 RepID=UPI003B3A81DB
MVCGGFACSRNALCAINVVYVLVGLLLLAVAAWGRAVGVVSWVPLVGGVLAVGVLLLLIAAVGLLGAAHHHQVLLFFYMVVLGLLFLVQFSVSCSCLALDRGRQEQLFGATWPLLSNATRWGLEQRLDCCGTQNSTQSPPSGQGAQHSDCPARCRQGALRCRSCTEAVLQHSDEALKLLGGVGLFFSFTEVLGVWLAMRYRNQKDPRANPSAFL